MSFVTESVSTGFGVPGISIEQTVKNPYDVFRGTNLLYQTDEDFFVFQKDLFKNTSQTFETLDKDKRISLGLFFFEDDNLSQDNFAYELPPPFYQINKRNLVNNGDCKYA